MELLSLFFRPEFFLFLGFYVVWKYCRQKIWIGDFSNRHVFITGCDSGFGRLLAEKLHNRGINVYAGCLLQQSVEELNETCSSRLKPVLIDVSDSASVRKARDYIKDQLNGRALWAVVNNAGIAGVNLPFEWMTKEDCRKAIDVNLLGVFDVTLAFLPLVKRGKQGRIVNMASALGRVGFLLSGYTMSKYGVEGFSDGLSIELYPYNITVHTLEPGYFKTNILDVNGKYGVGTIGRKRWETLGQEVKDDLGEDYIEKMPQIAEKRIDNIASSKLHLVVEAYEHAILAKFPNNRYVVGNDAKYLYIPMSWLPFPYQFNLLYIWQKIVGSRRPSPKTKK